MHYTFRRKSWTLTSRCNLRREDNRVKEDKVRDPMPPLDATPEEIGKFWDTHSLDDYWDETEEVKFQVNLKSEQNQVLSECETSD